MSIETIIQTYGYIALFIGAIVEGETVVLIAGFLAHRGYLQLPWVMIIAFSGAFIGDQFFFHLGRKGGTAFLDRKPRWKKRIRKVRHYLERFQTPVIVGFRFFYGMRTVTPLVIGLSGYSVPRFLLLNAIGALLWAIIVGVVGYAFGNVIESLLFDIGKYEKWIVLGIAAIGTAVWLIRRKRWERDKKGTSVPNGV